MTNTSNFLMTGLRNSSEKLREKTQFVNSNTISQPAIDSNDSLMVP